MVEKPKNRVTVNIMGEEYTIKGTASSEIIQQVARYVDELMRSLAEKNRHISKHKIAVLTAINLADELMRLKTHLHRYSDEHKERGEEDELV